MVAIERVNERDFSFVEPIALFFHFSLFFLSIFSSPFHTKMAAKKSGSTSAAAAAAAAATAADRKGKAVAAAKNNDAAAKDV